MNVIFIGESEENFLLLKTVKSNVIWEKREDFLQKIANNTVLFLEKKAFYKYHTIISEHIKKKVYIYLLNDVAEITPIEIQQFQSFGIVDILLLPTDLQRLEKSLALIKKAQETPKKEKLTQYYIKPSLTKRVFDIFMSFMALLFLSPFFIITILLIKITSKGPIFYISKRVGNGYRIFDFYKFRTMRVDADKMIDEMQKLNQYAKTTITKEEILHIQLCGFCQEKGECQEKLYNDKVVICERAFSEVKQNSQNNAFLKVNKDPRITPIGHFLRKSSIDELPQLLNVLKGDMSLVGNRPLPLYEAENLTTDDSSERFLAPAGLTGLWQVSKRGNSDMSAEERKELDNEYARNQSFWGDIRLILRTIPIVFQKEDV